MNTIPVIIDDIKTYDCFSMARCIYYSVECDSLSPDRIFQFSKPEISFYLMGLSGVIYKPLTETYLFNDHDEIEALFNCIEESPSLFVDTNDVWIPTFLFKNMGFELEKGLLYRIVDHLFNNAYMYREGRLEYQDYLKLCEEVNVGILYSKEENDVFKKWIERHIEVAKNQYPKNENLALKWLE